MLTASSLKHSINTYWITSREAEHCLWVEELAPSSVEVEKFRMREHDGCNVKSFFTFPDCFEHFVQQWEAKVRALPSGTIGRLSDPRSDLRALTCSGMLLARGVRGVLQIHDPACMGDKKTAGAAHPPAESDSLRELWQWTRDECPAYRRFMDTGEELDDEQNIDGFDAHVGDAAEVAEEDGGLVVEDVDDGELMEVRGGAGPANEGAVLEEGATREENELEQGMMDGTTRDAIAAEEVAAVDAGVDEPRGAQQPAVAPTAEEPTADALAATAAEAARVAKAAKAAEARAKAAEAARAKQIAEIAATREEALRVKVGSVLSVALSPQKVEGAVVMSVDASSGSRRWIEPDLAAHTTPGLRTVC